MKRSKLLVQFICQNCGNSSPRWIGKCPSCGEWNSYIEERVDARKTSYDRQNIKSNSILISEIKSGREKRIPTNIGELDRVLGGGFVPGSVVLIGGDPGIGKSTLALQMLSKISSNNLDAIYVTGEESPDQVKLRAERTGTISDRLFVLPENILENILEELAKLNPQVAVIDSIQTMYTEDFPSAAGSVGQIRECTSKLMRYAKKNGCTIFLIGHVTKEGTIAGPKVLEHLVD
ncbi:MAG: ATPase domain-containing protein, partial [Thermodesulfobacteriota bacterium]